MENLNKITLETFLKEQRTVYNRFRDNIHIVRKEGISPSNVVQDRNRGGYLISLRPPAYITENLKEFSLAVAGMVPAIVFDETNAHTSLVLYGVIQDFVPDEEIIQTLENSVHTIWNRLRGPEINYVGWLYNQDSAIAEGYADSNFVFAMNLLMRTISQKGIPDIGKRKAWGGHLTTNRFIEKRTPETLGKFFELMDNPPPGLGHSIPTFLDVGYANYIKIGEGSSNDMEWRYIVTRRFEF